MRQIGTVATQADAERFLAYLVTQRIDAQTEAEADRFAIWVRDEDQIPTAKAALVEFQADPAATRYQDAKRQALTVAREEEQRRRLSQKNVVEMRNHWGGASTSPRKAPLMMSLAGLAIVASLFAGTLNDDPVANQESSVLSALSFADRQAYTARLAEALENGTAPPSPWISIAHGQLWRLVTPIFVHFGVIHLIFNLMALWRFGGQIEDHRGATKLAILVLITAIISNIGQALATGPFFGGLSGVGYGLFGYLWMRIRQGNVEGYQLAPGDVFFWMLWFFLCIARQYPPTDIWLTAIPNNVANVAHAVGLVVGAGLALLPDPVKATGK